MATTQEIIQHGTIDDLVFRGRNKAYGAYHIRQVYNSHLKKSLIYLFSTAMSGILTFAMYQKLNFVESTYIHPIKDTTRFVDVIQPDIPKPQDVKPLPPSSESAGSEQLVEPIIVDKVEDKPIKTTADITHSTQPIGNSHVEGDPNVNQPIIPGNSGTNSTEEIFSVGLEVYAEFPGGEDDLIRYLQRMIEYPKFESENEISGNVVLQFVVNKDGSISDINVVKKDRQSFNQNAVNVVANMPRWKPAQMGNHAVRSYMELPINFTP